MRKNVKMVTRDTPQPHIILAKFQLRDKIRTRLYIRQWDLHHQNGHFSALVCKSKNFNLHTSRRHSAS